MKKLIGSLIAVVMVASAFMTTTFASGNTFTVTTDKDTYAAGDTVTVTVELTGTDDFAGFKGGVTFDTNAFTAVSAKKTSRTDWDGSLTFGKADVANTSGTYSVNFTNAANNPMLIDDEQAYYSLTYTFTAKSIAEAGDFEFNFVCEQMINETFVELTAVGVPTTVTVEADEPVGPTGPVAPESSGATKEVAGENDLKTIGYMVTANAVSEEYATANGLDEYTSAISGVTIKATANEHTEPVEYTFTAVKNGIVKVAVNVINVPSAETVDFTYELITE